MEIREAITIIISVVTLITSIFGIKPLLNSIRFFRLNKLKEALEFSEKLVEIESKVDDRVVHGLLHAYRKEVFIRFFGLDIPKLYQDIIIDITLSSDEISAKDFRRTKDLLKFEGNTICIKNIKYATVIMYINRLFSWIFYLLAMFLLVFGVVGLVFSPTWSRAILDYWNIGYSTTLISAPISLLTSFLYLKEEFKIHSAKKILRYAKDHPDEIKITY